MLSLEFKNTLAKFTILSWIVSLIYVAIEVAKFAVTFDINVAFGSNPAHVFTPKVVQEVQVIILMLAVSIVGGVAFMIKDFYRSVKYANLYSVAYSDYRAGQMALPEFQRLVTVEIYTGRFNYTWIYWFFIQPILSSALGVIAFFIARSGLGLLQGATAIGPDLSIQSMYLYAVFTFLAGFSSHKFIAWLDRLADKIFSTTIPERTMEQKAAVITTASTDRSELRKSVAPTDEAIVQVFTKESETASIVQDVNEPIAGFTKKRMKAIR